MKSIYVIFVVNTLLLCNRFVLMSSVPAGSYGEIKLFQSPVTYSVDSTILHNDVSSRDKDVGYKIKSTLTVDPVWSDSASHFLLKFELKSPKLHVRSRAAPHEGFIEHKSLLDGYRNAAFFAEWTNGYVGKIYVDTKEELSLINYKKGIVSTFQFQILDGDTMETDVSGMCEVSYHSMSPTTIRKIKKNCSNKGIPGRKTNILSMVANSVRITSYGLTEDLTTVKRIYAEELHEMRLAIKQDAGNKMRVWQEFNLLDDNHVTDPLKAKSWSEALQELETKHGYILKEQDLKIEVVDAEPKTAQNLANVIKQNGDFLKDEHLGTEQSALAFITILEAMRTSKSDEIVKALKGTKNNEILQQLCDIAGFTQTFAAHQAAKTFLSFNNEHDKDHVERYLWALSMGVRPHEKVIVDVLKMSEDSKLPGPVAETLLLTAAAMTHNFIESRADNTTDYVSNKVKDTITRNLSKCKESSCYIKYLRALGNLRRADTVVILIDHVQKGQKNVAVMALKSLRAMPKEYWTREVVETCKRVFYQLDKRYDSSARIIAIDIVLEGEPMLYELHDFVNFLVSDDKDFEVKQFILQKLQMMSERCGTHKKNIGNLITAQDHINNWDTLAQKGLSTALLRPVSSSPWSNVSLVSVQEISGGLLKQGRVGLLLEGQGERREVFSLGLFATGLSSLIGSSGSEEVENDEEEVASAGMELSLLGVGIRPFVFFSGQGELMGHVWSGTASERTTAFQSLMLAHEEARRVVLGTGAVARHVLAAALSFELAGQVQLSLWNRVAHSLVDMKAGIVVKGTYSADMPFVKSETTFLLTLEPRLELESDVDFYDGVQLCIQVTQPDTLLRHNITKVESIPHNKHVMRKSRFKSVIIPGRTYALNRKNNLMCNDIHKKK